MLYFQNKSSSIPNHRYRIQSIMPQTKAFNISQHRFQTKIHPIEFSTRYTNVELSQIQAPKQSTQPKPTKISQGKQVRVIIAPHLHFLASVKDKIINDDIKERQIKNIIKRQHLKQIKSLKRKMRYQQTKIRRDSLRQSKQRQYNLKYQNNRYQTNIQNSNKFKQSACFLNKTKHQSKQLVPGPGHYSIKSQFQSNSNKKKNSSSFMLPVLKEPQNNLLQQLTIEQQTNEQQKQRQIKKKKKIINCSPQFRQNNYDRFGSQIYPITVIDRIPTPGRYKVQQTIQQKSNKQRRIMQQRDILKYWFNSQQKK